MKRWRIGVGLLLSVGWVTEASAQELAPADQVLPPAPPPPPAAPEVAPPPAPPAAPAPALPAAPPPPPPLAEMPPAAPTAATNAGSPPKRSHLFSTLQLGGGYFHATSGADPDLRSFRGGTISGLLAVGGRLGRTSNVALAGAFLRDQVLGLRSRDQRIDGDEPNLADVTFGLWAIGLLLDVATQTEPGLHFQAFAGVGALSASRNVGDPDDPTGLMASVAAGYDFRVGARWAVGGLLRATYAPLDVRESTGTVVYITVPALLLTVTTR